MNNQQLSIHNRKLCRRLARECYLEADSEQARKELLEKKLATFGFDIWTIANLIILAVKLWLWWRDRKVTDPGEMPLTGEPDE
jgi:hypothetical protein